MPPLSILLQTNSILLQTNLSGTNVDQPGDAVLLQGEQEGVGRRLHVDHLMAGDASVMLQAGDCGAARSVPGQTFPRHPGLAARGST